MVMWGMMIMQGFEGLGRRGGGWIYGVGSDYTIDYRVGSRERLRCKREWNAALGFEPRGGHRYAVSGVYI